MCARFGDTSMVWQRARGRSALYNLDSLRPVRVTTFTADGEPSECCEFGPAIAPDAGNGVTATRDNKDREGCVGMPTLAVEANGT